MALEDSFGSRSNASQHFTKAFVEEIGGVDKTLKIITLKQFQRVMRNMKLDTIKFAGDGIDEVFAYFDFDEKGLIHYDDVVLAIFPLRQESKKTIDLEELMDQIQRKMLDSFGDPKEDANELFLEALDRLGKSEDAPFIDKKTFKNSMKSLGLAINEADVDAIFDAYAKPSKRGWDERIDYEDFVMKLGFKESKSRKGAREGSRK